MATALNDCEYLGYFIKEVIRMSTPGIRSSGYYAVKAFTTADGVHIPKGMQMSFGCGLMHHDSNQW